MKRKLTIAIAAILTISLLLAGCAVASAPTETAADDAVSYGAPAITADTADTAELGTGYRGGNAAGGSYAGYGAGGGLGAGNGIGAGNETGLYYTDSCDPINDGTATADPNFALTESEQTLSLAGYGSTGALDDDSLSLADMLTYALQDEYLAYAEYDRILSENGNIRPFFNIIRAENTHIDALLPLFDLYGIATPADEGESLAVSVGSLTEAYQAGVNAEVNNIAMYETFLDQNLPSDVRVVFESLMHASENHLRAFQNQL